MAQQTLNTPRETTLQRIADALEDILDKIVDTSSADNIDYDNTESELTADKVQGAIDELAEEKADIIDVAKKVDKYLTITTPTDLNTILESGFYSIPDGCTNRPSGMAGGGKGTLIVVAHPYGASAGLVLQILVNQLNVNRTDKMYYRIGTIGTQTASFLDWNRVLNLDDNDIITSAIEELQEDISTSQTAIGNPITIESSESNLVECVAEVEAVQEGSGDPSPTNIRPIIGQTEVVIEDAGKNLFDGVIENGTINTNGENTENSSRYRSKNYTAVIPNREFAFSKDGNLKAVNVCYYDGNNNFISTEYVNGNFMTPNNCFYVRFFADRTINVSSGLQLELGNTATDFEPYKGKTYTIQLGDTIYGGELDVVTGELTVTHEGVVYDGSSDEEWYRYNGGYASAYAMEIVLNNKINYDISQITSKPPMITNYLEVVPNDSTWGNYDNFISMRNQNLEFNIYMCCGIKTITTVADWKTYLASNPLQVVYELAEPYTIQLTPRQIKLLKGTNNLSCNTGDLTIKYYPDNVLGQLKGDIEKGLNAYYDYQIQALWDKINELQA